MVMSVEDRIIENLENLGLTNYEARVYYALVKLKKATAPAISKISGVPKPKVYSTLESLEEKGYVLSTPGEPSYYIVVDPKIVFSTVRKKIEKIVHELEDNLKAITQEILQYKHPPVLISRNFNTLKEFIIENVRENEKVLVLAVTSFDFTLQLLDAISMRNAKISVLTTAEHSVNFQNSRFTCFVINKRDEETSYYESNVILINSRIGFIFPLPGYYEISPQAFLIVREPTLLQALTYFVSEILKKSSKLEQITTKLHYKTQQLIFGKSERVLFEGKLLSVHPPLVSGTSKSLTLFLTNYRLVVNWPTENGSKFLAIPASSIVDFKYDSKADTVTVYYRKEGKINSLTFRVVDVNELLIQLRKLIYES